MANTDAARSRRPTPQKYLELARREGLGKLKVFLGAAPGVGKTYAMLSAARVAKSEGVDVVVGVVETHGRAETAALLDELEVLPRRALSYRGRTLMEFDVEAAIARKPKLILIDEFAHDNAPGALHAKRYQDTEELLRAGIDVWTTLNIQHLESLNDVVERITGVKVRETIPDRIVDAADEIVVVDLPPDELVKRLKDGKVYLPDNARRAVDQFFRLGNLTALRELALRRTTDRVDEKMIEHLRQHAIEGAWPTAERLLVCVGGDDHSERVVRTASRMAAALKSPWTAIQLLRFDAEALDRSARRRTEKALRLAERLGAETVRVSGKDMVAEILLFARRNNITQIVIGRSPSSRLAAALGRTLSEALIARADDIAVTVVAPDAEPEAARTFEWPAPSDLATAAMASAAAVIAATLAGIGLSQITPLPNASLLYLLAVLVCALRVSAAAAVGASLLSFFAYNFFFIEPLHTFTVAEPYELVALFVFLLVAFVTAGIAGRVKSQSNIILERSAATQQLYDYARKLAGAGKLDDVVWVMAHHAAQAAKGASIVLLSDGDDLVITGGWPPQDQISTADWAAARWSFREGKPAGRFTGTMPSAAFHFRAIGPSEARRGVIGVELPAEPDGLGHGLEAELQALCDQGSIALERTLLVDKAARAEAVVESERLRGALLSSISHDLRTPLSSIVGSVTSLRTLGKRMSPVERDDLLATIDEEAGRLSRFVGNLLDMTRLEAGALDVRRDWVDVADVARGAVARARRSFPARRIDMNIVDDLPLVRGDAALLEQALFNILDNADKYAGAEAAARLTIRRKSQQVEITIADDGPGVPGDALQKIFEKFYRVSAGDGRAAGTGLGLSICRGVISAMGGSIVAESPVANGKGLRIAIRLPIEPDVSGAASP